MFFLRYWNHLAANSCEVFDTCFDQKRERYVDRFSVVFVERYVDNMDTKDLVQYVMDDMMKYMESLPDNQVIDECVNYWDDHFENVVDEIKEYVDCEFKIPIEERFNK